MTPERRAQRRLGAELGRDWEPPWLIEVGPGKKGSRGWMIAWLVLHHGLRESSKEVFSSFQSKSTFTY